LGSFLLLDLYGRSSGLSIALKNNASRLLAFSVLFGFGYGGTFTILQAMISVYFGPRELGRILGMLTFIGTVDGFAGISSSGFLRTWMGSYMLPFMAVSILCGLMLVLLFSLRQMTGRTY
jgi:MFS family permease